MIDFMLIGAQRCGTTWWYNNARKHPEIYLWNKEVHYWNQSSEHRFWYHDNYIDTAAQKGERKAGDITPAYAILSEDTIKEIHACFPDMRILYFIRNPLRRAWSSFLLECGKHNKHVPDTPDSWFLKRIERNKLGVCSKSNYETCLRNWLKFYDRESICVMEHDDLVKNPNRFLQKTFNHIGVDDKWYDPKELTSISVNYTRAKTVKERHPHKEPREVLFEPMLEQFSESIDKLEVLLGKDFSHWKTKEDFMKDDSPIARKKWM